VQEVASDEGSRGTLENIAQIFYLGREMCTARVGVVGNAGDVDGCRRPSGKRHQRSPL